MPPTSNPFFHQTLPNFLPTPLHKKLLTLYSKLQFHPKSSDLFHFFQTHQLATYKPLQFFTDSLSKVFKKLCTEQEYNNSFYSIFASYYFEGDYLLCHDDIVEDRKYAFSYYLEDYEDGGELVLFNQTADRDVKRIQVRGNLLAIFEVCDQSYHEVAYCRKDGRKAITGWFNVKGQGDKRVPKEIAKFVPHIMKQPLLYPLDEAHIEEQYFQMMDIQYQFNITNQQIQGPFYSRQLTRLQIDPAVVFQVPGYTLLSTDYYKIKQGNYLLLNDPVNTLTGDIIDIFVTKLPAGYKTDEQQQNMLIKIVEEDGSLSGIPEIDDSLFVVRREKKQYYIQRNKQEFIVGHFIYRKGDGKIKNPFKKEKIIKDKNKNKNQDKDKAEDKEKNKIQDKDKNVKNTKNSKNTQNTKKKSVNKKIPKNKKNVKATKIMKSTQPIKNKQQPLPKSKKIIKSTRIVNKKTSR